ncbi:DUF6712 family protein [Pedobacter steynii]
MKTKTILISEDELKSQSLIELNVAAKGLRVIIKDVQHNQLRKILGNTLYGELLAKVDLSLLPDTDPNYLALSTEDLDFIQDYIQPFLIAASVADFIILNNYKLTNKGVLQLNDVQAQNVAIESLEHLKNYYDNKVQVSKADLVEYVSGLESTGNVDKPAQSTTSSATGLYIEPFDYSNYFNRDSRTKYL